MIIGKYPRSENQYFPVAIRLSKKTDQKVDALYKNLKKQVPPGQWISPILIEANQIFGTSVQTDQKGARIFHSTGDAGKKPIDEEGKIVDSLTEGKFLVIPLVNDKVRSKKQSKKTQFFLAIAQIRPGKEDRFLLNDNAIKFLGLNSLIGDIRMFKSVMSFAAAMNRVEKISVEQDLLFASRNPQSFLRRRKALTAA